MDHLFIHRPSHDDALRLRALTAAERRALRPGWPLRRFRNLTTGANLVTRDADVYGASADWIEMLVDLRPPVPLPRCRP